MSRNAPAWHSRTEGRGKRRLCLQVGPLIDLRKIQTDGGLDVLECFWRRNCFSSWTYQFNRISDSHRKSKCPSSQWNQTDARGVKERCTKPRSGRTRAVVSGIKNALHAKTVLIIKKLRNWTARLVAITQVTTFHQLVIFCTTFIS